MNTEDLVLAVFLCQEHDAPHSHFRQHQHEAPELSVKHDALFSHSDFLQHQYLYFRAPLDSNDTVATLTADRNATVYRKNATLHNKDPYRAVCLQIVLKAQKSVEYNADP